MILTFWSWFFGKLDADRKGGWQLLFSWWLILDATIAGFLLAFLRIDGFDFASKALFPAASILVSMAIAWTARASAILNDSEFREKIVKEDRPIEDYVYSYQLSLLIIMSVVVYVAIMAAGGLKIVLFSIEFSKYISSFFLYFLLSLAIRECWSVINFSNLLGILGAKISKKS